MPHTTREQAGGGSVAKRTTVRSPSRIASDVRLDRVGAYDESVFVGREREIASLVASFEEACSGKGRLVLLSGEPGIGKTTLVRSFLARLGVRPAQVLWGRCVEHAPELWPWSQALGSYVIEGDWDGRSIDVGVGVAEMAGIAPNVHERVPESFLPHAAKVRRSTVESAATLTAFLKRASRREPLILILDDLQWSDEPSLAVLQYLAREIADARLLVIGIHRDTGVERWDPLFHVLGALAREPVTRHVRPEALRTVDVAHYIERSAGSAPGEDLVTAMMGYTGGNPFFVSEVVSQLPPARAAASGDPPPFRLPDTVRSAVCYRLDALSPECCCMLITAAAVGCEFDHVTLDAVGPCCVPELAKRHADASGERCRLRFVPPGERGDIVLELMEEALTAGMIAEVPAAPGRFSFTHVLIQETLLGERTAVRLARLRRRIGETREKRNGHGGAIVRTNGAAIAENGSLQSALALPAPEPRYVFRTEGDLWTVMYEGSTFHLENLRGAHYLAQLLYAPGRGVHVCDLIAAAARPSSEALQSAGPCVSEGLQIVVGLGDAGSLLDDRAVTEYRLRLADLDEELAEAERLNDVGRTARIQWEIDCLTDELAAFHGRRRISSHAERARLSVTKGIAIVLKRIAARHSGLAAHLRFAVKRGYVCSYTPDPRRPISWQS